MNYSPQQSLSLLGWLLFGAIWLAACLQAPLTAPDDEDEVYQAALDAFYGSDPDIHLLIIHDHTRLDLPPGQSARQAAEYIKESSQVSPDQQALNDFVAQNRRPYLLEGLLPKSPPAILIGEVEFRAIFEQGGGWEEFYDRYPHSPGILSLSRVGFNVAADQAVVYLGSQGDYTAGSGYYILLGKLDGSWKVLDMVLAWIS